MPDDATEFNHAIRALEAIFQKLRSELGAVCRLTDKDPVVVFPKLGEIRQNKSQALPKLLPTSVSDRCALGAAG